MTKILFYICLACWVVACAPSGKLDAEGEPLSADTIRYAKGFSVKRYDAYTRVDVRDPWDSARLLQRYLLIPSDKPLPSGLPEGTVVKVPASRVVVYTSVHASIMDRLGEAGRIIGVCEPRYIDTPIVRDGLRSGRVADLGEATAPNIERMIDIAAELVIASPFENSGYGPVEKIGIPIIEGADYMEPSPLGRAEWIRFYGLLFGKEALADSIFRDTERAYLSLCNLVTGVDHRPTVLSEKKYGSSWFMSAGDSYMARLFSDAGADYLFKDLPGSGSVPLSFETVLDKALHADLWLIKYNSPSDLTYDGLRSEYAPYAGFEAFQKRRVYACNTGKVPYYEEFPLHPDYLLKDLIWIFHPELLPDYSPRYYRPMPE